MGAKVTEESIAKEIILNGNDIITAEKVLSMKQYMQHGTTSVYEHVISVAKYSLLFATRIESTFHKKIDRQSLVRGALLHDYFLYDWHTDHSHGLHGYTHPYTALKNATSDFEINKIEHDIIKKHMFPLTPFPPKHIESFIVCMADKWCALAETFKIDVSSVIFQRVNMQLELDEERAKHHAGSTEKAI